MKTSHLALAAVLAGAALAARAAQEPPKNDPPRPEQKPAVEKLEAWPKLGGDVLATVRTDVERLRKARTPEMGLEAEAALTAVGAGAVPELLPVLGKERDPQARLRVEGVLAKITDAAHTRLLAAQFGDKAREVRTWALHRCAQFPDNGVRQQAEDALARAKAAQAKDPKEEGVEDEVYAAALCVTSAGSRVGLPVVERYVLSSWGKKGAEMRVALEAVRSDEATEYAAKLAQDADRKKIVAGLNMLAGCGSRKAILVVKPHLDSTDNSIRVAAINAMRGIVDGDLPIDKLPVFEAIELAKKWKERAQ